MTIRARVALARERLSAAGIPEPEAALDARLLAQHILDWDAARFVANAGEVEPSDFAAPYDALVEQRARRTPLAYLTGHREFWGLSFEVTPAVLIPRPETELIVESVCELFPGKAMPLHMADIGTGSGCLAVALAREFPAADIVATDVSTVALDVARRNASRHGVVERIQFVEADLLPAAGGPFDLILSNPPYVADSDRATLQPEVRDYEPSSALFAGQDGMAVIERLVARASSALAPGGRLIFEFGSGQALRIEELISATPGLTMVALRSDLQGIPRVAVVGNTKDTEETRAKR